jgi:poly-gamma-glutamate synthesis protein (capsule biosynthesis protein)
VSTDGEPQQGNDSFGAGPALVPVLRDAGFDALSLANNHTGDYGERALRQTVRTLQQSPIRPFGAGDDLAEAAEPAVLTAPDGTTYAFLGFNAIGETPMAADDLPGALSVRMPPRTGPLDDDDLRRVTRAVRHAQRAADVVVVVPHWGTQYTHVPVPEQRTVARTLVAAGADLVVGGHPHWVQGVDAVRGVPVLHSLGNFVFDMDRIPDPGGGFMTEPMEGVVLEATFWGPELKAIRLLPYRMDATEFAPRRIAGADVLADVWSTSTGPFAD